MIISIPKTFLDFGWTWISLLRSRPKPKSSPFSNWCEISRTWKKNERASFTPLRQDNRLSDLEPLRWLNEIRGEAALIAFRRQKLRCLPPLDVFQLRRSFFPVNLWYRWDRWYNECRTTRPRQVLKVKEWLSIRSLVFSSSGLARKIQPIFEIAVFTAGPANATHNSCSRLVAIFPGVPRRQSAVKWCRGFWSHNAVRSGHGRIRAKPRTEKQPEWRWLRLQQPQCFVPDASAAAPPSRSTKKRKMHINNNAGEPTYFQRPFHRYTLHFDLRII